MKYTKESIAPCKMRVSVSVEAEEVDASIDAALKLQQQNVNLPGFRKGRVPFSVIEGRFRQRIYEEASQDLTNVHLNRILGELGVAPVTALKISPDRPDFGRGRPLEYSVEFEHLPLFDLPDYEGLEVTQRVSGEAPKDAVQGLINRLRDQETKHVPAEGGAPAADGQFAVIDLDLLDGERTVHSNRDSELRVGQGQPPELDDLVRSLKPGETGQTPVTFPADFMNEELQGRTLTMRVTVHSVKDAVPPSDEDLLKKFGAKSMEELERKQAELVRGQMDMFYRSQAVNELVSRLLKMSDFPVPPSLVEAELAGVVDGARYRAMSAGKALSEDEIRAEREAALPSVTEKVRTFVLLMAVARKEGLDATEEEVKARIVREAVQAGVSPQELFEWYRQNDRIFAVRDAVVTDKAANAVYAKAKVDLRPASEAAPKASAEDPAAPVA